MMYQRYPKLALLLCVIALIFFQCSDAAPFVPERHKSLDTGTYEEFRSKLLAAYQEGDEIAIAYQLANLKAPNQLVYKHLKDAVKQDVGSCEHVFLINRLAVNYGFFKSLYKMDTTQFYEVFDLCLNKLGEDAYREYEAQQEQDEQAHINNRPKLDSAAMNPELVAILKKMEDLDKKYREKLADNRIEIPDKKRARLWKLQKELDSLNFITADSILTNFGYPGVHDVGYDLSNVIWFVLQHQEDIAARDKHLPLLEDNLSEGHLEMYKRRTEHLKKSLN